MKKNTLKTLVSYLTEKNDDYMVDIRDELAAELEKGEEKARANRELYDAAHDVVMQRISTEPVTICALYELCADALPEGFSKSKLQYAILNYWTNEVVKHDNGRFPFTYSKVEQ